MNGSEGYRKRMMFLSNCIQEKTVHTILFLGCDSGLEPFCFHKIHPEAFAVGIDIKKEQFNRNFSRYVELVACDGAHLPFRSKSFDWEYCSHVLEHVRRQNRLSFIAEIDRTTKKGLVIACPNAQRLITYFAPPGKPTFSDIIFYNILDWIHRFKGTFELYHRGFTRNELTRMLSLYFNEVECISNDYNMHITKKTGYELIVRGMNAVGLLEAVSPSHVFICREPMQR